MRTQPTKSEKRRSYIDESNDRRTHAQKKAYTEGHMSSCKPVHVVVQKGLVDDASIGANLLLSGKASSASVISMPILAIKGSLEGLTEISTTHSILDKSNRNNFNQFFPLF